MNNSEYYLELSFELERYVEGKISMEELERHMDAEPIESKAKCSSMHEHLWHAIFQFENDLLSDDEAYIQGIRYSMNNIIRCLRTDLNELDAALDRYFNHPCHE